MEQQSRMTVSRTNNVMTRRSVYALFCTVYLLKKEERKSHKAEMRMLQRARLNHVRNVDTWKEARLHPMAEFLRERRLRWFGHEIKVRQRERYYK